MSPTGVRGTSGCCFGRRCHSHWYQGGWKPRDSVLQGALRPGLFLPLQEGQHGKGDDVSLPAPLEVTQPRPLQTGALSLSTTVLNPWPLSVPGKAPGSNVLTLIVPAGSLAHGLRCRLLVSGPIAPAQFLHCLHAARGAPHPASPPWTPESSVCSLSSPHLSVCGHVGGWSPGLCPNLPLPRLSNQTLSAVQKKPLIDPSAPTPGPQGRLKEPSCFLASPLACPLFPTWPSSNSFKMEVTSCLSLFKPSRRSPYCSQ